MAATSGVDRKREMDVPCVRTHICRLLPLSCTWVTRRGLNWRLCFGDGQEPFSLENARCRRVRDHPVQRVSMATQPRDARRPPAPPLPAMVELLAVGTEEEVDPALMALVAMGRRSRVTAQVTVT